MKERELKQFEKANPIKEVAVELGLKVRGSMGRCFRTDRHLNDKDEYTLFFNLAQNSFFCKTCPDVGGSVIDLVCQFHGWNGQEAVNWLAHRAEFDQMTRELYYGKGKKK